MLSFLCEERTIKCAEEIQLCCSPTQTTLSESGQAAYFAGLPSSLRLVPKQRLVLFVSGVQRATIEAVNYACSISEQVTTLYVEIEPGSGPQVHAK